MTRRAKSDAIPDADELFYIKIDVVKKFDTILCAAILSIIGVCCHSSACENVFVL